jgi:hypothetical protein
MISSEAWDLLSCSLDVGEFNSLGCRTPLSPAGCQSGLFSVVETACIPCHNWTVRFFMTCRRLSLWLFLRIHLIIRPDPPRKIPSIEDNWRTSLTSAKPFTAATRISVLLNNWEGVHSRDHTGLLISTWSFWLLTVEPSFCCGVLQ